MSKRTLPDEVRSVLLAHALEAPEPSATVHRVLAATVAPDQPAPSLRGWSAGRLLGVAAALLVATLLGGGIALDQHQQHQQQSTANRADAGPGDANAVISQEPASGTVAAPPRANIAPGEAGGVPPNPPGPTGLNCAQLLPGSHRDIGSVAKARLPGLSQDLYIYDFRCLLADGRRSASTVAVYAQTRGALQQRAILIPASEGAQVDFVSSDDRALVVQLLDPSWALIRADFISDDGVHFAGQTDQLAPGCTPADLTARITQVERGSRTDGEQPYAVQLTKHSDGVCVLSGYLTVSAPDGTQVSAVPTLRGSSGAGGTGAKVPEIVQLVQGTTVSAMIEPVAQPKCPSGAVVVSLPSGTSLGLLPASLALCGAQVHPIVPGGSGSD